jgi:Spy/CpxP family protein refolding chaperone
MNWNHPKALAFLAVPAVLLIAAPHALADPPNAGPQGGGHRAELQARHQQFMRQLGISPEQMQQIKAIRDQGKAESEPLHQQLRTKQQAFSQYMQTPDANEAQARRLFGELNDAQRKMGEQRIKTWFQMRQHLTPDQLQRMNQAQAQRRERRGSEGRMRPASQGN